MDKNQREQIIDEIWFKLKNMSGYSLEWEWMAEEKDGKFLKRDDVLNVIDEIKNDV